MPIAPAIACERTAAGVRLDLSGGWTIDVGARLEKEAAALVAYGEGALQALGNPGTVLRAASHREPVYSEAAAR